MNREEALDELHACGAVRTGHFELSSGLRTGTYLQCALAMMDARRGERLCAALADSVRDWVRTAGSPIDTILAPAMGGIVVGYEMGRQLGVPSLFCERVGGRFQLRRGFSLRTGQRVLIVEDVVTTGKSSMEAVACVREFGAEAVAVASLIDRRAQNEVTLTLPLIALASLDIPTFTADATPDHLKSTPAVKPGSRPADPAQP